MPFHSKPMIHASALMAIGLIASAATADVIDPPLGPIAPTPGPEPRIAISPAATPGDPLGDPSPSIFKITQPGSYYLAGNIVGEAGKNGIEIAASDVTLDLNGFDLVGVAGSLDAVTATDEPGGGIGGITVVNGSARNWGGDGVDLRTAQAVSCRVERVTASGNAGAGITAGSGANILDCISALNTGTGFVASGGSTVSNCTAMQNNGNGIEITSLGLVNVGSTVSNCATRVNRNDGILAAGPCTITSNSCADNGFNGTGAGISVTGGGSRIEGNNCVAADRGIAVSGAGNVIVRNTCSGNTTRNWDVVAGNVILVVNATTGSAFTGNAGGTAPGSTDPNANFTY